MTEKPLISCVLPTYNRAAKLTNAVQSVLSQTYSNFEILIVDDQSVDDTALVVRELMVKDARIQYLHNPVKGANNARNFGIDNAKGEYIAFLDDDDVWMETKLEKQVNAIQLLGPEYGVVYCTFARKKVNGTVLKQHPGRFSRVKNGNILNRLLNRNFITTSTLLIKAEAFAKCGKFNPKYKSFQDWELLTRIAVDYHFFYVREVLVNVYESNDSITLDKKGRVITKYMHLKQFMNLYESRPGLLSARYSSLGFTLVKLKRYGFAGKFLKRSLKINPMNFEALILILFINVRKLVKI